MIRKLTETENLTIELVNKKLNNLLEKFTKLAEEINKNNEKKKSGKI